MGEPSPVQKSAHPFLTNRWERHICSPNASRSKLQRVGRRRLPTHRSRLSQTWSFQSSQFRTQKCGTHRWECDRLAFIPCYDTFRRW